MIFPNIIKKIKNTGIIITRDFAGKSIPDITHNIDPLKHEIIKVSNAIEVIK
jgi:hypothetical protein